MKTLTILIFSGIIFMSCTDFTDQPHYYVDKRLSYFVNNFFKEAEARHIFLPKDNVFVELYSLPAPELGVTIDRVRIDLAFFNSHIGNTYNDYTDSLLVEYVVFHEMGHYLLNRKHVPNTKYSIMTVDGFYMSDYQTDSLKRKELIDELFKL